MRLIVVLCCAAGVGFTHFTGEVKKMLSKILSIDQDNYPEMLGHTCIINAGGIVSILFRFIKPYLDIRTQNKIEVRTWVRVRVSIWVRVERRVGLLADWDHCARASSVATWGADVGADVECAGFASAVGLQLGAVHIAHAAADWQLCRTS